MDGHGPLYSFVDCDMLVRHFGHGVGHLKYERQQEINTKRVPRGGDNYGDNDTSESEEREEEFYDGSDDTESEGDPVVNTDDGSDDDSKDIEYSESYSTCNSEDDSSY